MRASYLMILLQLAQGYITYDEGRVIGHNGYQGSKAYTYTQTFSGNFQNTPEIIVSPYQISLGNESPGEIDMDIISVTLTNFQVKIDCPEDEYVGSYYFDWLAIDQAQIQVLHPSDQTIVTNGTIYTHSHDLSKATQAIVILDSFRFVSGGLNFYLLVYQVTATEVKIQLITNNNKLKKVGYTVVLGTKEAFSATALEVTGSGDDILGSYSVKALQNSLFYSPLAGFSWSGSNNIRFRLKYQLDNLNYTYTYETFSGTIMNALTFQSIQFFSQILFPFYARKYRSTKQYIEYPQNQMVVTFIEQNTRFTQNTLQTFSVPKTQVELTIQLEIVLSIGKKLQGFFLKCNECGTNNQHLISYSYISSANQVKYYVKFLQYTQAAASITFSMTQNQILIQQVVNQVVDSYDLINIQITNL